LGTREREIESYLNQEIALMGGISRKWVSPNHCGVPDRLIIYKGAVIAVEVKTISGKLTSNQMREHKKLILAGMRVETVYGFDDVDKLIGRISGDFNLF
jgi:hypothetical protein